MSLMVGISRLGISAMDGFGCVSIVFVESGDPGYPGLFYLLG